MHEPLEEMSLFFDKRVNGYEKHMLEKVSGARRFYTETARLIPTGRHINLLDLGCGTGLELDEIFKLNPTVQVTGIDLSSKMLEHLKYKHEDKADRLNLIQGSYFDVDFGKVYDIALSVQTMHHFTYKQKVALYSKICHHLRTGGCYIETDYIADSQKQEDFFFARSRQLTADTEPNGCFYHIDTPCTITNQIRLLKLAGFQEVALHRRYAHAAILIARK